MFAPTFFAAPLLLAAVAAATGSFSTDVHAQPALTLDRALQAAQDRSSQLPAQAAAALAAREMAVAAGQRPDPTLKLGISNLPIDGPDRFSLTRDSMTMRSVGVMQELTDSDKLQARSARFLREAEAVEAARTWAGANLRRDTASAWLERYFRERMLALLETQRAEATLQIEASISAYRAGRSMQADVFESRSAVALIDDRIRLAKRELATAKIRLARWVGDEAGAPLGDAPALTRTALDDEDLEAALPRHAELALMAGQEAVARADAELARANRRADWSVELMLSQRGPGYANMLSLGLSIPLQFDRAHRQDREIAAKVAVQEQMRAQREEAARERLAEVRSLRQEWRSNIDRLAQYDASLIPLAEQRTQAATAAYRGGSGALTAVLEARRSEIEIRMDRLRLEMETAGRWAQLEYWLAPDAASAPRAGLATRLEQ